MDDPNGNAESELVSSGARRFVAALRTIEDRGEVDEMTGLGTDATTWWSTGADRVRTGEDGGRQFWEAYRRAFDEITSEFTSVTETPARVVLEWTSHGRHHSGRAVRYAGATVVELDENTGGGPVTGVRLYYDTAAAITALPGGDERDGDASTLDREVAAAERNSGLAPGSADASQ